MEQQQLKGARAAAAAWDALTPEEQEKALEEARQREAAEAAELAARFTALPTSADMRRLYDLAAQIAVIEQWDVATDRRSDCHMCTVSDLLDEVCEVFAEQDPQWDYDISQPAQLCAMDEEALFEESYRARSEAIRALIRFAERYIVLTWDSSPPPSCLETDALQAYDGARKAMAALGGIESAQQNLDQYVGSDSQQVADLSTVTPEEDAGVSTRVSA